MREEAAFAAYAAEFTEDAGYLNFASYGPVSRSVVAETTRLLELAATGADSGVHLHSSDARAVAAAARLSGFVEASVSLVPSTSLGLLQLAFGLRGGEVLVSPAEFPSNLYPWWRARDAGRIAVRPMGDDGAPRRVTPELVAASLTAATTAVSVSAVDFRTGYRADLAGIREAVGDRLLIVDGIQGFGVADLDWSLADALVVGGQKWMRAGWGAGFLALSDRALDRLEPTASSWTGVVDPTVYDGVEHDPAPGARRFSITNGSPFASGAFGEALELVEGVGIRTIENAIADRVQSLLDRLDAAGVEVASPRERTERAGIVVVRPVNARAAHTALAAAGITTTLHGDDRIRVSVHASTTEAALAAAADTLKGFS